MYLKISNPVVLPVECFTMLGASTSRGDDGKIGQFGTGAKHACLYLLREGVEFVIFRGMDKLEYSSQPITMRDGTFNQVTTIENDGEPIPRDYVLEHGALDWTDIGMALREFISNAIDGSGFANCSFGLVNKPSPEPGHTCIYIFANEAVRKYWHNISNYFLHWRKKENVAILGKTSSGPARIFRKGVFVKSLEGRLSSLFDYNISDLSINECRNSDEGTIDRAVGRVILADRGCIAAILDAIRDGKELYETNLPSYYLYPNYQMLREVWAAVLGEHTLLAQTPNQAARAREAGYRALVVPLGWYSEFKAAKIRAVNEVLKTHESMGYTTVAVKPEWQKVFDRVWTRLVELGMTNGKVKPVLATFASGDDKAYMGYWDGKNTCWINALYGEATHVHLEEIAHYITGAMDCSRDFQSFAFNVAGRLL